MREILSAIAEKTRATTPDGFIESIGDPPDITNEAAAQAMLNQVKQIMGDVLAQEAAIFEKACRENAVPPIEGAITKGKLKRRGIVMVTTSDGGIPRKWLEQRGRVISPVVIQDFQKKLNKK